MSSAEREDRKMAVINLTCDYPFKYCVASLANWSGLSYGLVARIVRMLNLDVKSGENIKWRKEAVQEKLKHYLPKQLILQ